MRILTLGITSKFILRVNTFARRKVLLGGILAGFCVPIDRIGGLGTDDEIITRDAIAFLTSTATSSPIHIEHGVGQIVLEDWHAFNVWSEPDLCCHITASTMTLMEDPRTFRDLLSSWSVDLNSLFSACLKKL